MACRSPAHTACGIIEHLIPRNEIITRDKTGLYFQPKRHRFCVYDTSDLPTQCDDLEPTAFEKISSSFKENSEISHHYKTCNFSCVFDDCNWIGNSHQWNKDAISGAKFKGDYRETDRRAKKYK